MNNLTLDNKTFGYLCLGAIAGVAIAALISQRERIASACSGDTSLADYRKQSGEGSETTRSAMGRRDEEMFRAEVEE